MEDLLLNLKWSHVPSHHFFDNQLKFDANTESIVKRGQQRIHLLMMLNSCCVFKVILSNFYHSFKETFSFVCWFNGLSVKDKNSLNSIIKVCSKITGVQLKEFIMEEA